MTFEEPPTGLIPWFSKLREILTLHFAASPSPLRGKPTQAQDVARRISGAVVERSSLKSRHTMYPSQTHLPRIYIICHLPLVFLSPTSPLPFYSPSLSQSPLFSACLLLPLSFACLFLFACVLDYLLPWRKIIPNCVISRIPIIMIFLVLLLLLLMMLSLVKSMMLC